MSEKTFYIDNVSNMPSWPIGLLGYLLACPKCGKKIIVETTLNGSNHNMSMSAICADCWELNESFKQKFPDKSQEIEIQVAAFKKGEQDVH